MRKNNFDLWRCQKCSLIFVFPLPENTDKLYSSDYFFGATEGFGYVNYDEDKSAMSGTFAAYLEKIKKFSNGNKVLDVGKYISPDNLKKSFDQKNSL